MDNVVIWKIKSETVYEERVEKNFDSKNFDTYWVNPADFEIAKKTLEGIKYIIIFIFDSNYKIISMYVAEGNFECYSDSELYKLNYKCIKKITSKNMANNIASLIELDLKNDFNKHSYISVENSESFAEQIEYIVNKPYECECNSNQEYEPIDAEKHLHALAQKNQYCKRKYSQMSVQEGVGEFQSDYERIVHSKAFRRMVDKAQIFSASKGDYYRTRMTHTLTVVQIAKGISNRLGLNLYLTEAIAMGHDLGHTPFGHQGERTLNDILNGKIELINFSKVKDNKDNKDNNIIDFGGFKHNYQSVRVVDSLEEEYVEFEGLNLSFQTLEGMFKHTKIRDDVLMEEFVDRNVSSNMYLECEGFSTTLEGQVVAIADEIAQRSHDLDDAFAAGLLNIDELTKKLEIQKAQDLKDSLCKIENEIEEIKEKHRRFIDENELINSRLVSEIISYFINDVISFSKNNMSLYPVEQFQNDGYRIFERIIDFSEKGKRLNDYLDKIISNKVINSSEVTLFDDKSSRIVKELFKAYYNNPRLLHEGTLQRLKNEIRKSTPNSIDFINGDNKIIKKEFSRILGYYDCGKLAPRDEEYEDKHKKLVRCICDYIAGMTDTYASNEYNKIYG